MKSLKYIGYALLGISALVILLWAILPNMEVDTMLRWAYLLLGLSVALIVLLPLVNMIKNPKGALRSIIGLALVVVLFVIFFSLGSGDAVPKSAGGFFENVAENKLSDAGLFMTYAAMAVTIIVSVFGEIRNALK